MNIPILKHYREDRTFRQLMVELAAEHRPRVPQWRPQATQDDNVRLMEEIKFAQAQQQGFDLLHAILTGERNG